MDLAIIDGIVSSKFYDKRGDLNFQIENFLFLDGDVPRLPSYGVDILQLIHFVTRFNVDDFNRRNTFFTSNLVKQCY